MMRVLLSAGLIVCALSGRAGATGFDEIASSLGDRSAQWWDLGARLRLRGALLHNLDLDRGLTPSGLSLYPLPADPAGQLLRAGDMRLRTDLGMRTPSGGMAMQLRVDVLDNLRLGGAPEGHPTATGTQNPPDAAFRLKRAFGMALTPLGYVAAGRMGSRWGLGMVANAGDCPDCDSSDSVDRVAFVTSMLGHLWAVAYDFSATGVDLDPADDVHTVTVAVLETMTAAARARRRRAGRGTAEYGLLVSHRWQSTDIAANGLPIERGFSATVVDGWLRLALPWLRVEAEVAVAVGRIEQPTLVPGALFQEGLESLQIGAALETEFGAPDGVVSGGVNAGFASGDSAPGFGAIGGIGAGAPAAGDLDGPQALPPHDRRIDNFRFHRDYRIDRILFREIVGTVTDAIYVRPHVRWRIAEIGPGVLTARLSAVASWAVEATSTPGGDAALGVELDPSIGYVSRDGFGIALDYAVLFPLAGLDNPVAGLSAEPAQLTRLRLSYGF